MNNYPLYAHHLTVGYRKRGVDIPILSDIDIACQKGSVTALLGRNGVGKSTLLRTLSGVQSPLAGDIAYYGKSCSEMSRTDFARTVSVVYTDAIQAGGLTVRELVSLGRQPYTGFFGRLSQQDIDIVQAATESVGISYKNDSYVAELSDGERQKVMIAKALAQQTDIILLDEPTAFLDVASSIDIMRLLQQLAKEKEVSVVLSTHDISHVLMFADTLWVVNSNRKFLSGTTAELTSSGAINSIFSREDIQFSESKGDFIPLP